MLLGGGEEGSRCNSRAVDALSPQPDSLTLSLGLICHTHVTGACPPPSSRREKNIAKLESDLALCVCEALDGEATEVSTENTV